jgi:hypothetical protein
MEWMELMSGCENEVMGFCKNEYWVNGEMKL